MRARTVVATAMALVLGMVTGAVVTLSLQSGAAPVRKLPSAHGREPERRAQQPQVILAWTPGEMPTLFEREAEKLPSVAHAAVVRSGLAWLTRSRSADGSVIDDPPRGLAFPLETAGVDPAKYRSFVPPADRQVLFDLAAGKVALGESSARLRGLGVGATLEFGRVSLKVSAVLPDELMGAHEVLASRRTAGRLGVTRPRYALIAPGPGAKLRRIGHALLSLRPFGQPMQIRAPGETPYFRMGDAVLPPVTLKALFGEFAARPAPGGNLVVDRAWEKHYIVSRRVPILGRVTCNREIIPQLTGALREIERDGLAHLIAAGDYGGCFSARFINHYPPIGISHHSWGVAIDVNVSQNPFGHSPHQNPRIVKAFADWGFTWGGTWIVPDGMHFEYIGPPQNPR